MSSGTGQKFGQTNDTSVIEILIKHLDEDGSGQIEFNEFLEFGIALEAFYGVDGRQGGDEGRHVPVGR